MYKKRYWASVLYPDSLPENWNELLIQSGLQGCYILHDKDYDPDGNAKKIHYHLILCYSGPTTQSSVSKLVKDVLNGTLPQGLESLKGYYRYLTHKDNPEKYQYNEKDIVCINGFSIDDYVDLSKSEVDKIKKELIQFIRDNQIHEYSTFIDLVCDGFNGEYFNVASNNTIFFNSYLKSSYYRADTTTSPMSDM